MREKINSGFVLELVCSLIAPFGPALCSDLERPFTVALRSLCISSRSECRAAKTCATLKGRFV